MGYRINRSQIAAAALSQTTKMRRPGKMPGRMFISLGLVASKESRSFGKGDPHTNQEGNADAEPGEHTTDAKGTAGG